jgi:hypothetical protein
MKKIALTLIFVLFSTANYSQNGLVNSTSVDVQNEEILIPLQKLIDKIKLEDKSLRDSKAVNVNVMVNDLLIENIEDYFIDPKNISLKEVLVLNANDTNKDLMKASIIINTRNK